MMPTRKLIVTDKRSFGTGTNQSTLVRMEAVTDPADTEAVSLNAGVLSFVVTARIDPETDLSAWSVGQKRTVDVGL